MSDRHGPFGDTRPGPERLAIQAYTWAMGSAPVIYSRHGRGWSETPPLHVADGSCLIYLDLPDGVDVYVQATPASNLLHVAAGYSPTTRAVQVLGWDHTGAALAGGFQLSIDVYPEVA